MLLPVGAHCAGNAILRGVVVLPGIVRIVLSRPVREMVRLFPDPARIVVDLPEVEVAGPVRQDGDGGIILGIRSAQFAGGTSPTARVVMDLRRVDGWQAHWEGPELVVSLEPTGEKLAAGSNGAVEYAGTLRGADGKPYTGVALLSFSVGALSSPAWLERAYVKVRDGSYQVRLGSDGPLPPGVKSADIQALPADGSGFLAGPKIYFVQWASFGSPDRAEAIAGKLKRVLPDAVVVRALDAGRDMWRVRSGPYPSRPEADTAAGRATGFGLRPLVVSF